MQDTLKHVSRRMSSLLRHRAGEADTAAPPLAGAHLDYGRSILDCAQHRPLTHDKAGMRRALVQQRAVRTTSHSRFPRKKQLYP